MPFVVAQLLSALRGTSGSVFLGQDATMIRRCMQRSRGIPLNGPAFEKPFEVTLNSGGDRKDVESPEPPDSVQVLRNGSLLASSHLIDPLDNPEFWFQ